MQARQKVTNHIPNSYKIDFNYLSISDDKIHGLGAIGNPISTSTLRGLLTEAACMNLQLAGRRRGVKIHESFADIPNGMSHMKSEFLRKHKTQKSRQQIDTTVCMSST